MIFSPDGRHLISGATDLTIKVWNVSNGSEEATLIGHGGKVASLAMTPDGKRVISGSYDSTIRVWDWRKFA